MGHLENCGFSSTVGLNGGAISWAGNNGEINGINGINSSAVGFGGAIYIKGDNNLIRNANFTQCNSLMGYDSIFIDGKSKNNSIEEIHSDSWFDVLDGHKLDFDVDYMIQRDWGGAILNVCYCLCTNCTFSNNYAKHGGAIFNQGLFNINNCTFTNNEAYGKGNDVFSADQAEVYLDGEKIENTQGIITHANSLSSTERTIIKISTYVASFTIAFFIGFFTANPTIGAWAGAAVGAALGTVASTCIIAYTYDINFNRFATAFEIISTSIFAGIMGGTIGGHLGQVYKAYSQGLKKVKGPISHEEFSKRLDKFCTEHNIPNDGIYISDKTVSVDYSKITGVGLNDIEETSLTKVLEDPDSFFEEIVKTLAQYNE